MAEADNPDNPAFGAQPLQSSASNAHASGQVIVQAPTAAILGKQITSGGQDGSDRRSQASGRSTASSVLRKRQLNKAAEANAPRPWPDDREYNPRAFFLFTLQHPIRQTAIRCIEWGKKPGSRFGWDKKVLIMILLNTITLAMMDPFDVEEMRPCDPAAANTPPGIYDYCDKMTTGKYFPQYFGRDLSDIIGKMFSAYFTFEMMVKCLALGFCVGPKTFMADSANWLDAFIVAAGLVDFMPAGGGGNMSALRALRVLRPLRAVNRYPDLRDLVILLGRCMSKLFTVVLINAFLFLVFGILGVQLYSGALRGRCFNVDTGEVNPDDFCSIGTVDWENLDYYWVKKDMVVTGGSHVGGAFLCPRMEEDCLQLGENPGRETVSFDDIGVAIMTIFQVMTLEGWADLCYQIQDTVGYWNWLYFVLLIMIGPMFCQQLFLVVIAQQYAILKKEPENDGGTDEAVTELKPEFHPGSNKVAPEPTSKGTPEPGTALAPSEVPAAPTEEESEIQGGLSENGNTQINAPAREGTMTSKKEHSQFDKLKFKLRLFAKSDFLQNSVMAVILLSTAFMAMEGLCEFDPDECEILQACLFSGPMCARFKGSLEIINLIFNIVFCFELIVKIAGLGFMKYFRGPGSGMNIFDFLIVVLCMVDYPGGITASTCYFNFWEGPATNEMKTLWKGTAVEGGVVTARHMFGEESLGISLIHPMELSDAWKESILSIPRIILADGEPMYNPMIYYFCGGGGIAAVFRALRLVRLIKFLRQFPEITKQLQILFDIMDSLVALVILIMIMIFIFTILGMNLLGGKVFGEYPPEDGFVPGMEVYVVIPWDENGGLPHHGKIHFTDVENHARAPYKIELEYGGNKGGGGGYDPMVNTSLGYALDEYGMIWATAREETTEFGVPYITEYAPRFHFDNLGVSFLTAFQVFTMANWNDDLYDVLGSTSGWAYWLYFFVNIVLGNWIIFNLFIAILIEQFAAQRKAALDENIEAMHQRLIEKLGNLTDDHLAEKLQALFDEIDLDGSGQIDKHEFNEMLQKLGIKLKPRDLSELVRKVDEDGSGMISFHEFMVMIKDILKDAQVSVDNLQSEMLRAEDLEKQHLEDHHPVEKEPERLPVSCFCIQDDWTIRRWCLVLTDETGKIGSYFGKFILLCILLSSVCLAMSTPYTGEDSKMTRMLEIIDILLNTAFTIELVAKLIANSWTDFWKSGWNKLDLFIVFTSDLEMALTYGLRGVDIPLSALRIFRVFRIFRALRPLRIIAKSRKVKQLVGTLLSAVKPVSVTLLLAIGILFVLAIFFVQLLGGRMKGCSDPAKFTKPLCSGLDDDNVPLSWGGGDVNFDNVWNAWIAMFILSSQDDWPSHMFASMDGSGPLTGPKQGINMGAPLFFIIALLITSSIVINMFVGVFVDCYYQSKDELEKEKEPNVPLNSKIFDQVHDDPEDQVRAHIYRVVTTTNFDMFIAFFIVFNVLSMATESFKPGMGQIKFNEWANFFFTFVFGWECIFKLYCLRPARYFANGWNKFDFFIVTISFIDVIMSVLAGSIGIDASILRILRIFRIFRILRAFRIFKSLKDLQNIVKALSQSAGTVGNLCALLFLLFFIFGVLGVNIGGHMCVAGDNEPPADLQEKYPLMGVRCAITDEGAHLETHGHFQGVGVALLTLWRIATSDAWGDIMMAVSLVPPERKLNDDLKEMVKTTANIDLWDESSIAAFEKQVTDSVVKPLTWSGEHKTSMAIAIHSLQKHKEGVMCEEDCDEDFDPEPYLHLARLALPACLREDEANYLSLEELMDCRNPGEGYSSGKLMCPGTCGFTLAGLFYSTMVAKIYFLLFVCISQFVLLQLVIAVLMDQLSAASDDAAATKENAPGCDELNVATLTRIYRRFNYNARRKLLLQQRSKARLEKKSGPSSKPSGAEALSSQTEAGSG